MPPTVPVKLTDVAAAAGVSLATASRAFNDPDRLAAGTRERVLAAAADLGYEVPDAARPTPRTLGVVVPDVGNAVFAALLRSMQDTAWHGRHRMLLASAHEDPTRERDQLLDLARTADGVVLCSPRQSGPSLLDAAGSTPLVTINAEVPGVAAVLMEVGEGVRQAVEHLYALGHRTVVYVPGPAASWADRRRHDAVRRCTDQWDVELLTVGHQAATVQGGLAAAAAVCASGATAAITYNDLVAIGVQAGARGLGRRCPDDLSVIGIDDLDVAAAAEPGLTSIKVAVERSGALAVELLLERIAGKATTTAAVHLESQLIVRGSTARVPAPRTPVGAR